MGEHRGPTLFYGYQNQVSQGTPATGSHLAFGSGTGDIEKNSNNVEIQTVGAAALAFIKGGGALTALSYNFDSIHGAAVLQRAVRSGGILPWSTISGGWNETADEGWHTRDCKCNSLSLKLSAGDSPGLLSGSMSFIGHRTVEDTNAEVVTDPTVTPFIAYEAQASIAGVGTDMLDFEMAVAHNLKPTWVLKAGARTANEKRFWDYLTEGVLRVTGRISLLEPWTGNVHADSIASGNLEILLTNVVDGSIIRLTVTLASFGSGKQTTLNEERQTYDYPFSGKGFAIASS